MPCEDGGETGAMTSQGMPRIADCHQKLGEKPGMDSPSWASKGINPADTLISSLQNYETINVSSLWHFVSGISRKLTWGRKQISGEITIQSIVKF